MSINLPNRRQHAAKVDSDLLSLLTTIKRNNAEIMRRLDIIEDKLSTADPIANTSAETTHKGAFLALKSDWIPKIMRFLSLIYEEVRTSDEDK